MEQRGIKRIYALTLLFVALLLATSLLIFLTVPPFLEQLAQIVRDAPHHREQLIALLQQRDITAPLARALQHAGLEQTFTRIENSLVGYAPEVLIALSKGVPTGLAVLLTLFIYQEFENRILVPRVYGRVLRLAPATVVLALLAGGLLLGVIGALLALPIAAGLQMVLAELKVELPGDDSEDRSAQARDAKTEATYERMSAGATAPEAGQIAKNLAHDIREADAADAAKEPVGATP